MTQKHKGKKPVNNHENNFKLKKNSSPNLLFQLDEGQKSLSLNFSFRMEPFDTKFVHFDYRNCDN